MKNVQWPEEKNEFLRRKRGMSFERILFHILKGDLLDTVPHPNPSRYQGQRVFVVDIDGYCWLVPFVEDDETIFLKTAIPSRKATRDYLGGKPDK
jgi:hypothetical protein